MSLDHKRSRWKWRWPDRVSSVDRTSLLRPFSFPHFLPLSLTRFFYPWITSSLNSTLPCHFSTSCFVFVLALLWKQWVGGAPVSSVAPDAGYSHWYQPATRVRARRCFLRVQGGQAWRGPADSWWTLPPSVIPPPSLPAPWWAVASRAHCPTQETKRWKLEGTFQPSSPSPTEKPFSPSPICGQWCPVRSLLTYQPTKSLSLKENFCFSGSEYFTRSVCDLIQEVSIMGNLLSNLLKLQKEVFSSILFCTAHKNKKELNSQPLCMQWRRNPRGGDTKSSATALQM